MSALSYKKALLWVAICSAFCGTALGIEGVRKFAAGQMIVGGIYLAGALVCAVYGFPQAAAFRALHSAGVDASMRETA